MTKYESMVARRDGIRDWLRENGKDCQQQQKHLEEGTIERIDGIKSVKSGKPISGRR